MESRAINSSTEIYFKKTESSFAIKTVKWISENYPIVAILPIWELKNHKIQASTTISIIANNLLGFVTFFFLSTN